jgi:hypothetical protein
MVDASLFSTARDAPPLRRWGDRRRAAVLIGSVVLHVAILAAIGLELARTGAPPIPTEDTVYLDMAPRPRLAGETPRLSSPSAVVTPEIRPGARHVAAPTDNAIAPPVSTEPGIVEAQPDAPEALDQRQAIARALRNGALGCRLGRSEATEPDRCAGAFAEATAGARPIAGTGDSARDARMAADSAAALANYERRRAPLKPYSRAEPCPGGADLMGRCPPISIQGRIWSSRDGWLPDLPGRD